MTVIKELAIVLLLLIALGAVLYRLYIDGYMAIWTKTSTVFVGRKGRSKNSISAMFDGCNGKMRKRLKFKESREYTFTFLYHMLDGIVSVQIRNEKKEEVLSLGTNYGLTISGSFLAHWDEKYYLTITFDDAKGEYELYWE